MASPPDAADAVDGDGGPTSKWSVLKLSEGSVRCLVEGKCVSVGNWSLPVTLSSSKQSIDCDRTQSSSSSEAAALGWLVSSRFSKLRDFRAPELVGLVVEPTVVGESTSSLEPQMVANGVGICSEAPSSASAMSACSSRSSRPSRLWLRAPIAGAGNAGGRWPMPAAELRRGGDVWWTRRSSRGDPRGDWLVQRSREPSHWRWCGGGVGDKCCCLLGAAGDEALLSVLAFLEGVYSQSDWRPLPPDAGPPPLLPGGAESLSESLLCIRW